MNKKRLVSLLVLCILVFILYNFFTLKNRKATELQELGFLHLNIEVESKYPLKWKEARNFFFYKGWGDNISSHQAVKTKSIIRFFSYTDRNRKLRLKLQNPNYIRTKTKLFINVYLNQMFLKRLELEQMGEFSILLPAEKLIRGENFIRFQVRGPILKIKKFNCSSPGTWYIINDIFFENIIYPGKEFLKLQKNKDILFQPANSFFKIIIDTNETKKLLYSVKPYHLRNRNCKLIISMIKADKNLVKIREFVFDNNLEKKGFIKFKNKKERTILEFNFYSLNRRSFLVWEKIALLKKKKKANMRIKINPLKKRPHIFLILIDAARYDLLNKKFEKQEIIPNINMVSKNSFNFTHFYANAPYTGASVASMLTSYLPEVHSVRSIKHQLPQNIKTLPVYLHKLGYKTFALTGNIILFRHNLIRDFNNIMSIRPLYKNSKQMKTSYNNIEKAVKIIHKLDTNIPSFIYFHVLPPHQPYNPPEPWNKKFLSIKQPDYNNFNGKTKVDLSRGNYNIDFIDHLYRSYLSNAFYADYLVGKIIKAIKDKKIFDNSLIIITSDHGEAFGEHEMLGHISSTYEEMIHVPFLVKFPYQKDCAIINKFYSHLDLLPTLAYLLRIPQNKNWQGIIIDFDLHSLKNGRNFIYSRAIGDDLNNSIFNMNYKYIFFSGRDELFDLRSDPDEFVNIAQKNAILSLYLKQKLFQQLKINLDLKQSLNINVKERKIKYSELINEIKTLGYISQ